MRCPKCEWIIAEYHLKCPQCQADLIKLHRDLGPFYEPKPYVFPKNFLDYEDLTSPLVSPPSPSSLIPEKEETPLTDQEIEMKVPIPEELLNLEELAQMSSFEGETSFLPSESEGNSEGKSSSEFFPEVEKTLPEEVSEEKLENLPDIEELLPPELKEEEKE